MSAPTYGQPIDDHYGVIISRYILGKNELSPTGWKKVMLYLPPNALRVEDPKEQDKFMEELLRLIRKQCSTIDPKNTHSQGLKVDLTSSEVVNKHLPGLQGMLYPGEPASPVWIDIVQDSGPMAR